MVKNRARGYILNLNLRYHYIEHNSILTALCVVFEFKVQEGTATAAENEVTAQVPGRKLHTWCHDCY